MEIHFREYYLFDNVPLECDGATLSPYFNPEFFPYTPKNLQQEIDRRIGNATLGGYQEIWIICARWNTGWWSVLWSVVDLVVTN